MITGAYPTEVKDHIFRKHILKHHDIKDIIGIHMTPKNGKIAVEVQTKQGNKKYKYKEINGEYESVEMPMNDR